MGRGRGSQALQGKGCNKTFNALTGTPHMTYWNDPFHFSLKMGEGIQTSLAELPLAGRPANFMVRLTTEMVDAHIAERRAAVRAWSTKHPEFVAAMQAEREKYVAERAAQTATGATTTK